MIYKFKPEARIPHRLDHEKMCRELDNVYRRDGVLTAPQVVRSARRRASALHDYFEWDDAVAGKKWRVAQAGHLIRSVVMVDEREGAEPASVRKFWPVTVTVSADDGEQAGGYVAAEEAAQNPVYRMQIRSRGLSELRALRRKYADFEEFARVFAAIDELAEAV